MSDSLRLTPRARILVTNDDGVTAGGFAALQEIAHTISDDVWTVAPRKEQSGMSHALTVHHPLRFEQIASRSYVVEGTPSDGIFIAMRHLFDDHKPDLILSGINEGVNLGNDVIYSATVAAAMEGAFMGIPAIAISQEMSKNHSYDFTAARRLMPQLLKKLGGYSFANHLVLNINFPHTLAQDAVMKVCAHSRQVRRADMKERKDPRGIPYFWIGCAHSYHNDESHTDVTALAQGHIAITPLIPQLTDAARLESLKRFVLPSPI